jgi:L,D-peptidoglycan transpeptidase YkuD (ErfK/YbiS/YcfS/YnhG family)
VKNSSQQLLVVTTNDWNTYTGVMQRYQRTGANQDWQPVGQPVNIVTGKHGLAWGDDGSHNPSAVMGAGTVKKEGDLRTPVGVFAIGQAFGFAAKPDKMMQLPYLMLSQTTLCVDDAKSRYYNQLIKSDYTPYNDWSSAEQMRDNPHYELGAVVQYNSPQPRLGAGSCIFMHIWGSPTTGTTGCVAMQKTDLQTVLNWLDPKKHPDIAIYPSSGIGQVR